ncbi:MAG TPA: hypothetical protein VIJ92_12105 [Ginsengibacter sp.]
MKTLFILVITIFSFVSAIAQASDLLILKKNNRTLQTFFPGNEIIFNTSTRYFDAYIQSINHDSLFLIQYDVRQVPTSLGIYMLDTVGTYPFAINYKEITGFGKNGNKKFDWSASGGALLGGGALLTIVGLGTWIFTKPNTQYYASPYLVGGAALLAGIGYLLAKSGGKKMALGKKYSLVYIPVK